MRGAYKQCKSSSSYAALAMHAAINEIDSIICSCWSPCHLSKQTLSWVFHTAGLAHCCLIVSSNKQLQIGLAVHIDIYLADARTKVGTD